MVCSLHSWLCRNEHTIYGASCAAELATIAFACVRVLDQAADVCLNPYVSRALVPLAGIYFFPLDARVPQTDCALGPGEDIVGSVDLEVPLRVKQDGIGTS